MSKLILKYTIQYFVQYHSMVFLNIDFFPYADGMNIFSTYQFDSILQSGVPVRVKSGKNTLVRITVSLRTQNREKQAQPQQDN